MEVNNNTKKFYEELEGKCDPEILLEIAKKGIFLFEPLYKYDKIKNHKYVVLISILAEQYFMINNDTQYIELKNIILSNFEHPNKTNNTEGMIIRLLIVNKFLLNEIINEKNVHMKDLFYTEIHKETYLLYLYKYKFISSKVFNLFYEDKPHFHYSYEFDIFEFLYFDNKHLLLNKLNNILEKKDIPMLGRILMYYCRDLNMLKFLSKIFCKNKIQLKPTYFYRVPLFFPLNILKEYANDFFSHNKLYMKYTNSSYIINTEIKDIDITHTKKEENENNDSNIKYYIKTYDNHCDKIYNFNIVKKYYYDEYGDCMLDDPYLTDINKMNTLNFVKTCLNNYDFLNNILMDPNYIFNINLSTNFGTEYLLMRLTYLISLIHNRYDYFIIETLCKCIDNSFISHYDLYIMIEIYDTKYEEPTNLALIYKVLANTPHKIFNRYCRSYPWDPYQL
ncbi:hypothetical protein BCR32DRAFT_272990 [Anaeromyces robustus]|uniref:Uncharacterized protein n=1 Tax=Anaeromyces robustus TaxID=1754192 RepID=A0A1Y1VUM2_9FUNG|nr:hypothetical protein BCR32DRAFT_272990 [Anaeromyces robustus]|eukprot:ORX64715.1 hypothetical protein BCR32DRAFT_272990 [Anaeromyces robustus]